MIDTTKNWLNYEDLPRIGGMECGATINSIPQHQLDIKSKELTALLKVLKARGLTETQAMKVILRALLAQCPDIESAYLVPCAFAPGGGQQGTCQILGLVGSRGLPSGWLCLSGGP